MGTLRRQYTDEFKPEAVGLLTSSGRPLSQIAQELGIASSRLRAWRNRDEGVRAGSRRRPNTQAAIPPAGADLAAENARQNAAHFLGSAEMKFRLIEDQRDTFKVRAMCDVLGVSPAGYYAWRSRPESHRKAVNRALLAEIRRVHAAHRGRYGAPRVHATLRAEGA